MNKNITIGIEGLVGAGKTSLCRDLKNKIPNTIVLHGGNLYRGIIYAIIKSGIDIKGLIQPQEKTNTSPIDIKKVMDILKVGIKIENKESVVYVDGVAIDEDKLQSDNTSMAVSKVSKNVDNSKFYEFARQIIENLKKKYNIVISGRDLMNIYPQLDYHIFITADLETRVQRKMNQYKLLNENLTKEEVREHIIQRDEFQEAAGYYKRYDNTIDIDVTDCESAEESANKVLKIIK